MRLILGSSGCLQVCTNNYQIITDFHHCVPCFCIYFLILLFWVSFISLSCIYIAFMSMFLNALCSLNTFAPSRFWGFVRKKHRNAHGFAREFLRSGIRYRPGQSLKIRSKPCSLHSKKIFWLGIRIFF